MTVNKSNADKAFSLYQQGDYDTSLDLCNEILLNADNDMVAQIKALCTHKLGRTEQALILMAELVRVAPKQQERRYSYALMLLYAGDFAEGWACYEYRVFIESFSIPALPNCPKWQGENLSNKRILVVCEQGFGDCMIFARYLPLLKQRGATITVATFPPLTALFSAESYVDRVITAYDPNSRDFDYAVLICSLPKIFAANWANIPTPRLFHKPSAERRANWSSRLPETRLRVGIAWSGRAENEDDVNRSSSLEDFLQLQDHPDISFISLQRHEYLPEAKGLCQLGAEVESFLDVAAIIDQLDWVITVDTALAHLAGSMGKETWVILPCVADWRWQPEGKTSPWYPSARLFRQKEVSRWGDVFDDIAGEILERINVQVQT